MVHVEVDIKGIDGGRTTKENAEDSSVLFNVDVSMSEAGRSSEGLLLDFTIALETEPVAGKVSVKGTAKVQGDEKEVDALLQTASENSVPPIFMKIYERVYPVLYLVCGSIKVPHPSPGLLKLTHMEATRPVTQEIKA